MDEDVVDSWSKKAFESWSIRNKKAFDLIDHSLLVCKLLQYDIKLDT